MRSSATVGRTTKVGFLARVGYTVTVISTLAVGFTLAVISTARVLLFLSLILVPILSACNLTLGSTVKDSGSRMPETFTPAPTQTRELPPTSTPSLTPTPTFTMTPTETPTPTPTLTPTPPLLVLPQTPIPMPLALIGPENAAQVSALAIWHEDTVTDLTWLPDGSALAVAHFDGIAFYDLQTRLRLRSLYPKGEGIIQMLFSPTGDWLVTGSRVGSEKTGYASNIQLWRGPYWQPFGILFGEERGLTSMAFPPNGNFLALAYAGPEIDRESSVDFMNTATWEVTRTLRTGTALSMVISPDGKWLASTPDHYAVKIWRLKDGKLTRTLFSSFAGAVNSLVFSLNPAVLATGHYDGEINLWDVNTGDLTKTLKSEGVIESLAFSPDGRLLASGSSYNIHVVQLWDVETGALLRTLAGHQHAVEKLLFSPDGQVLVSASYDGAIWLWGIRP